MHCSVLFPSKNILSDLCVGNEVQQDDHFPANQGKSGN